VIFPKLIHEKVIQTNDKTRLDASRSFVSDSTAIINVEIKPSASDAYISVFSADPKKWVLDWAYSVSGTKTISLKVSTATTNEIINYTLSVISEADDKLFSNDEDLLQHENNILDYIPKGRSSWLNKHRASQDMILAYFDEQRIWRNDGTKLTKNDLLDVSEVNEWSKFLTLRIIYQSLSVSVDDIFWKKSMEYEKLEHQARSRSALRFNANGDGETETVIDRMTTIMVRR
jgi:hypothetical protein